MRFFYLFLFLLIGNIAAMASPNFDQYFYPKTLRMDVQHCGNSQEDYYYFEELLEEPYWGGSKTNLIDTMGFGNYMVKVFDEATNALIYSRGFNSLFGEWQTIDEAKTMNRCIAETVTMPFPRKNVRVEIWNRDRKGVFNKKFEHAVDVNSYFIKGDRRLLFPTADIHIVADPSNAVDIVLLAEGYTADEMEQFKQDCYKFAQGLFSFSPYKENKNKFNIRAVMSPSQQSGSDIPKDGVWKSTLFNSSFYTFDSERYIMTYDHKSLRDAAANVPYDFIYILANTDKYGGGAIYNHYGLSVSGNQQYAKVYVHEFGHLFLGLGDEYVGNVSYNDMYPMDVEPWEPNLTTMVDFDSKWKDMLAQDTPVPTPIDAKDPDKLGVYEGGGYVAKGVYRPRPTCLMNVFSVNTFCPVCVKAIEKQIRFYTDK
ncbi:MAG: M64 family metallopeptidase [Marinifilaceae bacterium]